MGKNKNPAKRAKATDKPDANTLPSFDESALSALTDRIEKGLGKTSQKQEDKPQSKESAGHKSKKGTVEGKGRGTKRDAHGNAKKSDSRGQSTQPKKSAGTDDGSTLLQEILALGGTEDDLDLVAGAPSDDEDVEGSGDIDKELQKELAKFVAGLGIEGANVAGPEESASEEVEEEEEEAWEEASEAESIEEPAAAPVPASIVTAPKKAEHKDPNRLVSTHATPKIV